MRLLIILLTFAFSCSSDPLTWGEVAEEIAGPVCWKSYQCGSGIASNEIDKCIDHEVYHLCEVDDSCNKPAYGAVGNLIFGCTEAIYESECSDEFEWPTSCIHAFRHLRPPGDWSQDDA